MPDAGLVTDEGLAALAALPLQDLDLSCRRVGALARAAYQRKLPGPQCRACACTCGLGKH